MNAYKLASGSQACEGGEGKEGERERARGWTRRKNNNPSPARSGLLLASSVAHGNWESCAHCWQSNFYIVILIIARTFKRLFANGTSRRSNCRLFNKSARWKKRRRRGACVRPGFFPPSPFFLLSPSHSLLSPFCKWAEQSSSFRNSTIRPPFFFCNPFFPAPFLIFTPY